MPRADLTPDCGRCAAVCCVATSFEASGDFAFTKPAGARCPYLTRTCRCAVHDRLRERGMRGCAVYDCHGAGQRVTAAFSAEAERGEAFLVLRVVHELLWQLTGAAALLPPAHAGLRARLEQEVAALDAIEVGPGLPALDLRPHQQAARALLREVAAALGGRRQSPPVE